MNEKHVRMCLLAHMELTAKHVMPKLYYTKVWSEIMDDETRVLAVEHNTIFSLVCEAYVTGLFDERLDHSMDLLHKVIN